MQTISLFKKPLQYLLTDIDDTLTDEGLLGAEAYTALWKLHASGIQVIPVTGRPAGWCELIARQWPVAGVVGENGAFTFFYKDKKMHRHFAIPEKDRLENQKKLEGLQRQILDQVKGCAIASDQFCRQFDLAIDFCEDVPALQEDQVQKIVNLFQAQGAQAKISSIHVNGWFGNYNKKTEALHFLKQEFRLSDKDIQEKCGFIGDSPNDEPLWQAFENSFGVANVKNFEKSLTTPPKYITPSEGGKGFAELADLLVLNKKN
jgi:HAD superfamily hydrolase (TIGR01484 family)